MFAIIMRFYRGVAQLARALVSKTKGRGFESLHPCQLKCHKRKFVTFLFTY